MTEKEEQAFMALCDHCWRRLKCWEDDNQFCDEYLEMVGEEE